jgi:peptidoglycan hydrolase-like protein with peptidoglycan-binding domain
MISTYTDPKGRRVSHDYTAEIKAKMDYVDSHDPFAGAGATTSDKDQDDEEDKPPTSTEPKGTGNLKQSVGRGGVNDADDVQAVQTRLKERGVDPGTIDSLIGPKTIGAIERFQSTFLEDPDGNITPRKNTEKKLFGESGKVTIVDKKPTNDRQPDARNEGTAEEEGREGRQEEVDNPSYAEIAKNFKNTIPGSSFTWSDALWLPRWGRHAKPSDVTNTDMATIISNIQRQAAALQKVESHLGKSISVTSWLRPPAYNRLIGGASNSSHMRGLATDFNVSGMSAEQVRRVIKSTPGLYPGAGENQVSWVHLDLEHTSWFNP